MCTVKTMALTITVNKIKQWLTQWAPPELAAPWDSIGLQLGDPKQVITEVIVALEVDETVLSVLKKKKNILVVTHHPIFFKPLKRIRYDQDMGDIIRTFITGNHQLLTAHTNLDAAEGGVNDALIETYGLNPKKGQTIENGFGKFFDAPKITLSQLVENQPCQRQGASHDDPVKRLGFCAGSGHGLIQRVLDLGIDTFVTGEVNYHDHVTCRMNDIRLIVLGHNESEQHGCKRIKDRLETKFSSLSVTQL